MTNFEAISAELYPYDVDSRLIIKACKDVGVDECSEYFPLERSAIAKAAIAILRNLVVLASENNGGYSLSYNTDGLKERIFNIAKENGLTDIAEEFDTRSRITDISDQW